MKLLESIGRHRAAAPAALTLWALAIYWRAIGTGYLADDFLFLTWWQEGFDELLRRVTVDANPRVIRPLPALAWGLVELPGGAVIHHGLSLLVHALCGWLVARLAARSSGSVEIGWLAGGLFVAFPLLTEPVIWLSAAPDLWACFFALAALNVALTPIPSPDGVATDHPPHTPRERSATSRPSASTVIDQGKGGDALSRVGVKGGPGEGWGRPAQGEGSAAALFALSLLSKESTILLPLILLCLAPWKAIRRPFLALCCVAAAYLGFRWLLYGGLGGYLGSEGQTLALHIDVWRFLKNLTLQFPYRLMIPLKRAGELAPWLGLVSAILGLAMIAAGRPWRRLRRLALGLIATGLAVLPVAAFFSVSYDHENTRMLYFPAAVLVATLAGTAERGTRLFRGAALGLIVLWSLVTNANSRSWSEAGREVHQTLAFMQSEQSLYPAGSTIFVAGHDTWHGAYVWRNGLAFAARLHGLRDDLFWTLGTAALRPRSDELGRQVFELGIDDSGNARDWTKCQQHLREEPLEPLGEAMMTFEGERVTGAQIRFERPATHLAIEIQGSPEALVDGWLQWRHGSVERFNMTESRRFVITPQNPRTVVRLPGHNEASSDIELRIEAAEPTAPMAIRVVELPSVCR